MARLAHAWGHPRSLQHAAWLCKGLHGWLPHPPAHPAADRQPSHLHDACPIATLTQIATVSAGTAASFGITPRVAMLSYSTGASGFGPQVGFAGGWASGSVLLQCSLAISASPPAPPALTPELAASLKLEPTIAISLSAPLLQVDKVKAATALVKESRPDLFVEGEGPGNAALVCCPSCLLP